MARRPIPPDQTRRQIRNIENHLDVIVDRRFSKIVERTMNRIDVSLRALQEQFFTTLALKIVNQPGPPRLGAWTPVWSPLSEAYTEQRSALKGVEDDKFFLFSGKLFSKLASLNPTTVFGRPLISFTRGDTTYFKKAGGDFKLQASKGPTKNVGRISVQLFPNVTDIANLDEAELFQGVMVTEQRGTRSKTTPLSYRLKNVRGFRDRPIVPNYMLWWLNVNAREIVRGSV